MPADLDRRTRSLKKTRTFAASQGPDNPMVVCGDYSMTFQAVDFCMRQNFKDVQWFLAEPNQEANHQHCSRDRESYTRRNHSRSTATQPEYDVGPTLQIS